MRALLLLVAAAPTGPRGGKPRSAAFRGGWALVIAAAMTAGCAAAPQGLSSLTQSAPPEPYYKEYHETVAPGFSKSYNVSVAPGAKILNATLTLSTRGLPATALVPATADLSLGDQAARADPTTPQAHVELRDPAAGKYRVVVNATGPSQGIEGSGDYGATFVLVIQVAYATQDQA